MIYDRSTVKGGGEDFYCLGSDHATVTKIDRRPVETWQASTYVDGRDYNSWVFRLTELGTGMTVLPKDAAT